MRPARVRAEMALSACSCTDYPVRVYLREMGSIRCLRKRAKCIWHGAWSEVPSGAESAFPLLVQRMAMGIYEDLRQGRADVDDFAEVGGADTAAKDQKRTRALRAFNRAAKRYRELAAQQEELAATPEGHVRVHARLQSRLVRAQVRFSRALREVPFSAAQWTVFTNAFRDAEDELIALDSRLSQRRGEAR